MVFPLIPLLVAGAGAAANAVGSMIQGREEAENEEAAIRARNKAVRQELRRQGKYTRKAADIFTDSLDIYSPDEMASRMADAGATTSGAVAGNLPTDFGSIGSALAPTALAADERAFVNQGAADGQRFAGTLGQLLSHDQYLTENERALAATRHKLDKIADFSRGSARVNQIEQAVAGKNSQQQPSIWGPLLQAGGTIGSYLAGQGGVKLPFGGGAPSGGGTLY